MEILLQQLKYKCENVGINYIEQEESYTSGTSFLDEENPIKENYNKNRRIQRGLFKSNSGLLINSDVNGSFQIMKKVFPNAISRYGIEVVLTPIVSNEYSDGLLEEKGNCFISISKDNTELRREFNASDIEVLKGCKKLVEHIKTIELKKFPIVIESCSPLDYKRKLTIR